MSMTENDNDNDDNDNNACQICFLKIDKSDDVEVLKCSHSFHYQCIKSWFIKVLNNPTVYKNKKCPYCRCRIKWLKLRDDEEPIYGIHKIRH